MLKLICVETKEEIVHFIYKNETYELLEIINSYSMVAFPLSNNEKEYIYIEEINENENILKETYAIIDSKKII